jgi:endonuclease/exonuclease/phosphatase family metal-dependent hydrolase
LIKRDKEIHSIPINGEIHQKETNIVNLYTPKVNAPNFIKFALKDLKIYIHSNTVVLGNFNIPPSPLDRSYKQEMNKEIIHLIHTIHQMDLANVYRILKLTSAQYLFFSADHGVFSKIDHILVQKSSFIRHNKMEMIPCILSDHNALKLEINNNSKNRPQNMRIY